MTAVEGYAQAIVDVASAEGALEEVESELLQFEKLLKAQPELFQGMADPGVPPARRQAMVEELFANRISRHTVSLISLIVGAGRTRNISDIIERSLELAAESRMRAIAEVRAATSLTDDQEERLTAALGRVTGKKVELRVEVDPSVIGGVWAKVGDQVIDGTLRKRLDRVRADLRRR